MSFMPSARVGVDSVLVADVPVEESAPFRQAAMRHNVAPIFICPPNADDELLRQIASYGRGIPTCSPVRV
jgi:tryptophan synthase alpha chain